MKKICAGTWTFKSKYFVLLWIILQIQLTLRFTTCFCFNTFIPSREHIYIILTPLNPILYSKTGVYRGINYFSYSLRNHAYSNILKILPPKNENFRIKNSDIFHVSAPNIDCGYSLEPPRWGGSNEYAQSVSSRNIEAVLTSTHNLCFEQK